VTNTPCFLGSKFEYYLTNHRLAKFVIRVYQARTFAMPISNNRSDESAPERGNEPPAQGTALGDKGKITEGALTGQKLYRREEDAFAPPGRNHHTAYNPQGVALGYMIVGLSGRRNTGML